MRKKNIIFSLLTLLLVSFVVVGCSSKQTSEKTTVGTPTLFFHGFGSNYHAEEQMVNAAKKAGVTKKSIIADVTPKNKVILKGKFSKNVKNPIVEVNLQDNQNGSSKNVLAVIKKLQANYKFKKINLVGHSFGNLMIANYINENYADKKMPVINKVVSIAGHYNGWLGEAVGRSGKIVDPKTGKPDKFAPGFKQLLGLRKHYPKQIKVLNIYGDKKDGSKGDGSVSVASAQTYRYLINNRARSYQEVEITGKMAQHSKLHENKEVDKILIKFLWGK